jgi:hypothetical protein
MMPPCPDLKYALEESAVVASAVSERLGVAGMFMLPVTMADTAALLSLAPGSLRWESVTRSSPSSDRFRRRDETG